MKVIQLSGLTSLYAMWLVRAVDDIKGRKDFFKSFAITGIVDALKWFYVLFMCLYVVYLGFVLPVLHVLLFYFIRHNVDIYVNVL